LIGNLRPFIRKINPQAVERAKVTAELREKAGNKVNVPRGTPETK